MSGIEGEQVSEDSGAEQAAWREARVQSLIEQGIDPVTACGGVEWGVHWMEDHIVECQQRFGGEKGTYTQILEILRRSSATSFRRTPGVPRYPAGVPTLLAVMVARETFVHTQPPEDHKVAEDLMRSLTYGW